MTANPFAILPVAKWTAEDIAYKLGETAKAGIDPFAVCSPAAHSPLGASSAERWMSCPGSVTLIELFKQTDWHQDDDPDYRRDGTQAHELGAYCLENDLDAWEAADHDKIDALTAEMMAAVQVYLDYVRMQKGTREVEVRVQLPDFHSLFFGTLDCVIIEYDGAGRILRIHVIDYKHGVGIVVEVIESPQLMYYAWGKIAKVLHLLTDETPVQLTIVQPRAIHSGGTIRTWETTVGHIRDWAFNVLRPAMEVTGDTEYLALGEWCRFCPAKLVCPAYDGLANKALHSHVDSISYAEALQLEMLVKAVKERTMRRLLAGERAEDVGAKLVKKKTFRVFKGAAPVADTFGEDAFEKKLKGPAAIEKLPGGKAFVSEWAFQPATDEVTVAPLHDQRSEADRPRTLAEKYGTARK